MIQRSTPFRFASLQAGLTFFIALLFVAGSGSSLRAADVEDFNPVTCPSNVTVSCEAYTWDPADYGSPIVNGCCGYTIVGPTVYTNVNSCGIGTITRVWQICFPNYVYTCTQVITVTGGYNQVQISWPPDYTINGCTGSTNPDDLPAPYNRPKVVNQACSLIGIAYKDCVFVTENGCKMILRMWTVIDWCVYQPNKPYSYGIWEKTQVIKINDSKPPVINCPNDVTASVSGNSCSGGYVNIPIPIASDDCGSVGISHNSPYASAQGANASGVYPVGTTVVTFTARDGCNNTAKCTMKVTVKDNKPPTAYAHHGLVATLMNMAGGAMVELNGKMFDAGSTDNCTPQNQLIFGLYPSVFTCDDLGYNEVTMTVKDKSGNISTVKTYVIIQDNQGLCPPDTIDPTISCYNVVAYLPKDSCGATQVTVPKPTADDNRKFTVANNSPYATLPGIDASGRYPEGVTQVTFTVSDAAGNTASCVSTVTVLDTFAPVISCKNGYQLALADNGGTPAATLNAADLVNTISDNCTNPSNLTYSVTPSSFTCESIGEQEVTLTVTDASGNSDFCITLIEVTDPDNLCGTSTTPWIDCPGNVVLEVPTDSCAGAYVTMLDVILNDTLAVVSISNNSPFADDDSTNASGYYPLGTTEVVFIATDTVGGVYSCATTVTVKETEAPIVVCENSKTVNLALDPNGEATVTLDAASFVKLSMDNCTPSDQLSFSAVPAVLGCDDLGEQMVKIYAEDASGNKDFCLALVQVTDTSDICGSLKLQQSNCPKDIEIVITDPKSCGSAPVTLKYPITAGIVELKHNSVFSTAGKGSDASGNYPIGTTIVKFTVKFENGQTLVCPVKVTVKEVTPPVAICKHGVSLSLNKHLSGGGFAVLLPAMINRGSHDNCTPANELQLSAEPSYFTCKDLGLQRVKLTVTDRSGNSNYCYTYVNIVDDNKFCGPGTSLIVAGNDGDETQSQELEIERELIEASNILDAAQPKLFQNAPNPFRTETTVRFYLPGNESAKVSVYDMTGRLVKVFADGFQQGVNELNISRADLTIAGFYLVRLESGNYTEVCKMMLVD